MMRLLMTLLLMMTATAASAAWTHVAGTDKFNSYVDTKTIRRDGHFVKMWELRDYLQVQTNGSGDSYLSTAVLSRYDCKEEMIASLSITQYSGQMGDGEVVWNSGKVDEDLEYIIPGSVADENLKIACAKQ